VAYCAFVEYVLDTYDAIANPALCRTLIHNNLTSHKAPEVYKAVREWGHHVVCCPPYRPQDGPVEYAINQVCRHLEKRWSEVNDLESINITNNNIHSIDETLLHCGYVWNQRIIII
jgi:transposase